MRSTETTTRISAEATSVRRPTILRPAQRIKDPDSGEWQVEHRISSWRTASSRTPSFCPGRSNSWKRSSRKSATRGHTSGFAGAVAQSEPQQAGPGRRHPKAAGEQADRHPHGHHDTYRERRSPARPGTDRSPQVRDHDPARQRPHRSSLDNHARWTDRRPQDGPPAARPKDLGVLAGSVRGTRQAGGDIHRRDLTRTAGQSCLVDTAGCSSAASSAGRALAAGVR